MNMNRKKTVGIIGLGMIGNTMAVLTTLHGYETLCYVRSPHKVPLYKKAFDDYYTQLEEKGLISTEQTAICKTYLKYVYSYEEMAPCQVIFEAIAEDLDQKKACCRELERCCPNIEFIGSCSSSILPELLASAADKYRDRLIVTHPFYPVHMIPYFELCGCSETADGVLEMAKEFLTGLDRKPVILKKPNPGFIGNYLQFALWAAALKLLEDGVCDPHDIDTCLNYSFCPRYTSIGIFEHFDMGGYPLNKATCDVVFPSLPRYEEAPDVIRQKAADPEAWGARSPGKQGFYDWNHVDMKAYQERVNAPYWKFAVCDYPTEPCK